jgi:hypothetical protein
LKIIDYEKVQNLVANNVLLLDGDNGTKTILASDLAKGLIGLTSSQDFISGLNLSDLAQTSAISSGDKMLVGTASGNKAIGANDLLFAILDTFASPYQHRMVFRGSNLGSTLTADQKARISDGTFKGLWLGDYWAIGGVNWRIVDFDYWYNCGNTAFTTHHLVIMTDSSLYNAQMNTSNTTAGGYVGSAMYTENLANAKTMISSAFGNAVLTHREILVNAVTSGRPSGGAWCDSSVELPNEPMMYGSYIYTPGSDGSVSPYRYTISKTQLALFQAAPRFIVSSPRVTCWLRDVVSASAFAYMGIFSGALCYNASGSYGVRPVFPVGVA